MYGNGAISLIPWWAIGVAAIVVLVLVLIGFADERHRKSPPAS